MATILIKDLIHRLQQFDPEKIIRFKDLKGHKEFEVLSLSDNISNVEILLNTHLGGYRYWNTDGTIKIFHHEKMADKLKPFFKSLEEKYSISITHLHGMYYNLTNTYLVFNTNDEMYQTIIPILEQEFNKSAIIEITIVF